MEVEHGDLRLRWRGCRVKSGWETAVSLSPTSILLQHMMKISYDVVKRWINEAQEAASSDNIMVQVCLRVAVPKNAGGA